MYKRINALFSVSIVFFHPNIEQLTKTLKSLIEAVNYATDLRILRKTYLFLINNGCSKNEYEYLNDLLRGIENSFFIDAVMISGHGNVGYGRGHNYGIKKAETDYHLILNPDVILDCDSIAKGIQFLAKENEIGLIAPVVRDDFGVEYHLCKRYPNVFDLIIRALPSQFIKKIFWKRLSVYSMSDIDLTTIYTEVPIISGSYMLFRMKVLKNLHGFDPMFFLYFEDFDLSLRTRKISMAALYPEMKIYHYGGGAAQKSWQHIKYFIVSAFQFFKKYKWKFF